MPAMRDARNACALARTIAGYRVGIAITPTTLDRPLGNDLPLRKFRMRYASRSAAPPLLPAAKPVPRHVARRRLRSDWLRSCTLERAHTRPAPHSAYLDVPALAHFETLASLRERLRRRN